MVSYCGDPYHGILHDAGSIGCCSKVSAGALAIDSEQHAGYYRAVWMSHGTDFSITLQLQHIKPLILDCDWDR
jgi:hypothetical protein